MIRSSRVNGLMLALREGARPGREVERLAQQVIESCHRAGWSGEGTAGEAAD